MHLFILGHLFRMEKVLSRMTDSKENKEKPPDSKEDLLLVAMGYSPNIFVEPYDTGYNFDIYVREEDGKIFINAYV